MPAEWQSLLPRTLAALGSVRHRVPPCRIACLFETKDERYREMRKPGRNHRLMVTECGMRRREM